MIYKLQINVDLAELDENQQKDFAKMLNSLDEFKTNFIKIGNCKLPLSAPLQLETVQNPQTVRDAVFGYGHAGLVQLMAAKLKTIIHLKN